MLPPEQFHVEAEKPGLGSSHGFMDLHCDLFLNLSGISRSLYSDDGSSPPTS